MSPLIFVVGGSVERRNMVQYSLENACYEAGTFATQRVLGRQNCKSAPQRDIGVESRGATAFQVLLEAPHWAYNNVPVHAWT